MTSPPSQVVGFDLSPPCFCRHFQPEVTFLLQAVNSGLIWIEEIEFSWEGAGERAETFFTLQDDQKKVIGRWVKYGNFKG